MIGWLSSMIMPRRWSIGRTALVLLVISMAALAATWYAARVPWFYVTLFLVAWGWLLAGIQVVNFLHARRHSDPPARLRDSARRPAPPARAARRPGPEPGGASRARAAERALRDGKLLTIGGGTSEIQKTLMARRIFGE